MRIVVREIDMEVFAQDIIPVLEDHHAEVEDEDCPSLAIDYGMAMRMYHHGMLLILAAYDIQDGPHRPPLLGYSVDIISPTLHYKGLEFSVTDSLWVRPDVRGSGVFRRVIVNKHLQWMRCLTTKFNW